MRYEILIEQLNRTDVIGSIINDINVNYIKEDTDLNKIVIQCWGMDGIEKIKKRTKKVPGYCGSIAVKEYRSKSEHGNYDLINVCFTHEDIKVICSDIIE